jgi:predicted transcriptional regulator
MLSFACKDIKFSELIRCSFELNKTEYNVFIFLFHNDSEFGTSDIAKQMGLERTTVQKSIKNLVEKSLVFRSQQNLEKGGYIFAYSIKDKLGVKERMLKIVENWYTNVTAEIKKW